MRIDLRTARGSKTAGDSTGLGSLRQAQSDKDDDLIGKSEDGTVRIERRLEVNDDKDYREQNTAFLSE